LSLRGGDAVVLFTDGLHEAEGPDGKNSGWRAWRLGVRARLDPAELTGCSWTWSARRGIRRRAALRG